MSSTPLFDSISRRASRAATTAPEQAQPAVTLPAAPAPAPTATPAPAAAVSVTAARTRVVPAPTSPLTAPVSPMRSALVPAALVAAIDEIPQRVGTALPNEVAVTPDQLALVEAVTDAITRAVVDAVVGELERITRDGVVRG
ncbi:MULTISPECIES: hypothetical protein [unclassified Curtobacterium]|uniref:hypothetical protein n=1 Tax=unclassified Curtobacterium TaxID=257496 RepID=UPI001AE1869D|nr:MULTISPECIES: hypothetical protein [unclassified Curtobacterium]MBP1301233.1 outer membrane receptor protein involved in Fe transport [Curtobacterium sp. 1310]MCM3505889.1 hypothetical protein [Curtobacterium sp. ODYSSEY 48 V2]MCM3522259.1 hypothetical protein [Curtobacterium sp. P97]